MSSEISKIYACFSPETDLIYRKAMMRAARHRVVRVHHLIAEISESEPVPEKATSQNQPILLPKHWADQAIKQVNADPTGILDTPMTNSPTVRRVLSLCWARREDDTIMLPHLVCMATMCWREEQPPGMVNRDEVIELAKTLKVRPMVGYSFTTPTLLENADNVVLRIPTAEELESLIGPPVTSDDLIALYQAIQRTSNPKDKARLAEKLAYLQNRG